MKRNLVSIALLLICGPALAGSGNNTIKDQTLDEITQYGNLSIEHVEVKQATTVHGVLKAKDSKLNSVEVHGQVDLNKSEILGPFKVHGAVEIESSSLHDSVTIAGQTEVEDSIFEKTVNISGHTEIEESTFKGPITISGATEIEESQFENTLNVQGYLDAQESSFFKDVKLKSRKINLYDCKFQGNIVVEALKKQQEQLLNLVNTHIKGNVTFNQGQGTILMDEASTIDGKVEGAQIIKNIE